MTKIRRYLGGVAVELAWRVFHGMVASPLRAVMGWSELFNQTRMLTCVVNHGEW
jgi:hypothetical protein